MKVFLIFNILILFDVHAKCGSSFSVKGPSLFKLSHLKERAKHVLNGSCIVLKGELKPSEKFFEELSLSRRASKIERTSECLEEAVFSFDESDQADPIWRPQGVAYLRGNILISWYNRKVENGKTTLKSGERGMRLTVMNENNGSYDHFNFLDEKGNPLLGHADGLTVWKGNILLADYRKGFHIFKVSDIGKGLKRIGIISMESCKHKIYGPGNAATEGDSVIFSPYVEMENNLSVYSLDLSEIGSKNSYSANRIYTGLNPAKVQGVITNHGQVYFFQQVDNNKSHLVSLVDGEYKKFNLPPGVEDGELYNNKIFTVTEFEKKRKIIVLKRVADEN